MASLRDLKKNIDLKLSMVLNDCFLAIELNEQCDKETIMLLAADVIGKHRDLRLKMNHPNAKDNPKLVKQFYKTIESELKETVDSSIAVLSKAIKKD